MNLEFWRRRRLLLGALIVLVALAALAFQGAVYLLKSQVEQALGPRGEVREIRVGLGHVEILGLRLPADAQSAWPAADLLRAERVVVVPSLADLISARVVLRDIRIEGGYLSIMRSREQKLRVLPGLTDAKAKTPAPEISIGHIELVDSAVEYFDASIQRPPLKIRLEQINVRLGPIHLPDLLGTSQLKVSGIIKGPHHDGQLDIAGQIELGSRESDLRSRLRGVDLLALKPYLIRATETGIKRGQMDLDLHSTIHHNRLQAPGTLTLNNLELSGGNSFMGLSQTAVVSLMKSKEGKIAIQFTLAGDLNDPQFSLNEQMLSRIGTALAETLGISLEGLTKGVGGAGGSVMRGIGDTFGKLLGR